MGLGGMSPDGRKCQIRIAPPTSHVRAMKPDAKIYEFAAAQVKVAPEEIFFVDDRAENVAGARRRGWHAVQFSDARQLAEDLGQSGVEFNR